MRRFLSDRVNNDKMKSGRHERAWLGGGDPDRTGDPRLMSPLLCQLSYTATLRKEAAEDAHLTRGGIAVSMEDRREPSGQCRFPLVRTVVPAWVVVPESVFDEGAW